MPDSSSTPARPRNRCHAPAFAALVALALLHVFAAAHQFQHAVEHDVRLCQTCSAYNHLDDTAVSDAPPVVIPLAPHVTVAALRAVARPGPVATVYRSRAPPLS
ncbi:MAG: hypothetical protein MJA32_00070 [Proteobacteria bacterium]|nr:hypothetical protein [Pseudomonadota bacterium]